MSDLAQSNASGLNEDPNNKRKRSRGSSVSSNSSTSSSSSTSESEDSNRHKKRSKRVTKSKRSRRDRDKKLDKLFSEISNIKKQLEGNNSFNGTNQPQNFEDWVDDNVSRHLYDSDPAQDESEPQFSLAIGTKVKDSNVLKTPASYLEILKNIQRLGDPDWRNVRYSDVQKSYLHTPGFAELDANDEVKQFDTSRNTINTEKAFASICFALVKQRDQLEKEIRSFLSWAKDTPTLTFRDVNEKIQDIFVTGDFSKISNDALQLVCGHRAEMIQQRRENILTSVKDQLHKTMLRKIPPTCQNLFDAEKFTTALEKAGGVRKVFWYRQKDRATAPHPDPCTSGLELKNLPQTSKTMHYKGQTSSSKFNYSGAQSNNPRPFRGKGNKPATSRTSVKAPGLTRPRSPSSRRDRRGRTRRY